MKIETGVEYLGMVRDEVIGMLQLNPDQINVEEEKLISQYVIAYCLHKLSVEDLTVVTRSAGDI